MKILLFPSLSFAASSRSLDGVTDAVNLGQQAILLNLNQLSYSAWIKPVTEVNTVGSIIDKGNNGTRAHRFYVLSSSDCLVFTIAFSGTDGSWRTDDNTITINGSWQHVGMTYNRGATTNNPVFYIDGKVVNVNTVSTPTGTADDATVDTMIGALGSSAGTNEYAGLIAYVQIFNRIITDMAQTMYYPGSVSQNLIAYTPLWGTETTEKDYSGNTNNGTLSGTTPSNDGPPVKL